MKEVLEYISKIDDILASYEDWMHGENAEECLKARKYLEEIENRLEKDDSRMPTKTRTRQHRRTQV